MTDNLQDIVYKLSFVLLFKFSKLLEIDGLHQAFLARQVTLFAPTDSALRKYDGPRNENLILNHMTNIALSVQQLPEKLTSLVTGNPPLWISNRRDGIFVNQAQILRDNIQSRSDRGDEQVGRTD